MVATSSNQRLEANHGPTPGDRSRQRVLMVAHCFDADFSMESRLSWSRAVEAAKRYDTTVLCAAPHADICSDVATQVPGLQVVTIPHTAFEKFLISTPFGFYLAYRWWHRRVAQVARQLHSRTPFSLVHQVSYCGYREPGYCWQLGIPFVWGPIGGTQNVPWRFLSQFDVTGAIKEAWRTVANVMQLRLGRRVGAALKAAREVYVANREIQQSFRAARGLELPCQLETGVHTVATLPHPRRDTNRPLRVLWVGRLENWKALPLLLRAVAQLPTTCALELRVVGSGTRERRMKRLATRLGISERIEWVPLPQCATRDEHYQWADLFAFTSLRDTSGTGLLESLAAGVPIVGLDHQGARDIMSHACAVSIAVRTPRQVVGDLRAALVRLAGDAKLLEQLSRGAIDRAQRYHWDRLSAEMMRCYANVLGVNHDAVPADISSSANPPNPSFPSPEVVLQEAT